MIDFPMVTLPRSADLVRVRAGDQEAFGRLFDDYARDVWRFCRARGVDEDECDDLTSLTFLLAWRARERAFTVDDALRPWLFGIARNCVRSRSRSLRRFKAAVQRAGAQLQEQPDHYDEVIAELGREADARLVADALASLNPDQRLVVETSVIAGHGTAETAALLALPEGTVKSRLARARSQMRALARKGDELSNRDPCDMTGHLPRERQPAVSRMRTVTR